MQSLRTPLSRARGSGSARQGVGHWISERITAAALIPLVLWGLAAALQLATEDYPGAVAWMRASPLNPVLLALLASVSFWHMQAGLRVVIEDYIHRAGTRAALLLGNLSVCALAGSIAVFCILKVALGGA
ncbi:MAG: succinate dehydrogenase, hydrophobic membrane anchor protein [Brevundimonas sp.]|uniref:succinate dehydrogenase, hydrophobic membrane anchor protein n=1 Tax=Brevundimonas sp. TaxID=1871086 RepID=UPI002616C50B|nr:succinate dehydrogenase, hydrophobic membrane anchor protein [Brevundimonas sp.]MDI6624714.1 succinate dehydrogenase, hydrophobic membrane anchor protein [Brevundimonas sp.]MDQ7811338.1 succinate dehydrogenase, hydrophobic membrane anchor protein [Brevundimonas sp.]